MRIIDCRSHLCPTHLNVTVVEFLDGIVPSMDREIARHLLKLLKQQWLEFRFITKVTAVEKRADDLLVSLEPAEGGESETLVADVVLVAVGRRPYTEGLGLERVGITLDEKGRIPVSAGFKTAVPGIYAIGDVIAGPMLADRKSTRLNSSH